MKENMYVNIERRNESESEIGNEESGQLMKEKINIAKKKSIQRKAKRKRPLKMPA
jgi:hypothetical protein